MIRVQRYIAMQITFGGGDDNRVCDWVGESVQGRDSSVTHAEARESAQPTQ